MSFPAINLPDLTGDAKKDTTAIRTALNDVLAKLNEISSSIPSTNFPVFRNVVTSTQTKASAAQNIWYNQGGSLTLAPGTYNIAWSGNMYCSASNTIVQATLSTGSASESDTDFSAEWIMGTAAQPCDVPVFRMKRRVVLVLQTTLYLNVRSPGVGTPTIGFTAGAGIGNVIIEAEKIA